MLLILTNSLIHCYLKGWENVTFVLGSERVEHFVCSTAGYFHKSGARLQSDALQRTSYHSGFHNSRNILNYTTALVENPHTGCDVTYAAAVHNRSGCRRCLNVVAVIFPEKQHLLKRRENKQIKEENESLNCSS